MHPAGGRGRRGPPSRSAPRLFGDSRSPFGNTLTSRELPANHDPTDTVAALTHAMHTTTPALGVLYRAARPTLNDTMDEITRATDGKPRTERAAGA